MKRARTSGGSLTGGTGDVKPQIFTMNSGLAGALNDYVVTAHVLPIPRFGTQKAKATVFEVLWVDWYLSVLNVLDNQVTEACFLTTSTNRSDADTATLTTIAEDINDPKTFANIVRVTQLLTSGAAAFHLPVHVDLTDSNGNGVLIATDRLSIVGCGVGNAVAGDYTAKIGYRMTNIGISEYVGIVQSQQ